MPVTFAAFPAIFPDISTPGIVADAVKAAVPAPFIYPVRVTTPVPPFATATVPVTFTAFPPIFPVIWVPAIVFICKSLYP